MTKRNHESNKTSIRAIEGGSILLVLSGIFAVFWYGRFNEMLARPYENKGNLLMLVVYLVILALFMNAFGGLKIGLYRMKSMILSQMLGIMGSNFVCYLLLILMVGYVRKMGTLAEYIICMTLVQMVISVILIVIETLLFRRIYPPKRILVLYETRTVKHILKKIQTREDKYIISATIKVGHDWREELEKKTDYDAILIYDISSPMRNDILKYCYSHAIRIYMIPKISDILIRNASELQIFDTPILLCREFCITPGQAFAKRVIDVVVSGIGVVVSSPILLITALLIKLYDGGPVLYRQDRCTTDGKVFQIMKFRSMIVDAEKDGVARLATEGDSRITPIGNFIRKTRIDELPQFFNILKGEMSLVGPRPERPEIVEEYCNEFPEFRYRMKVKAGLTGYAQVYGKYNTTAYDKLKWDLMYIQKYSVHLDLQILIMTIKIIFVKESTEGLTEGERIATSERDC